MLQYKLNDKKDEHGFVYIEMNKGMYGLLQAGLLANQLLQQRLAQHGFYPVRHTHGYWIHITKPTTFVLVVDDFSVKYVNKSDADDLPRILQQWYTVKTDWSAHLYCGITTEWDYINCHVMLSMPGYIDTILKKLKHPTPKNHKTRHTHTYQSSMVLLCNSLKLPMTPNGWIPRTLSNHPASSENCSTTPEPSTALKTWP